MNVPATEAAADFQIGSAKIKAASKNRTENSDSTARSGISQICYRRFHGGKTVIGAVRQILVGLEVFHWAWDVSATR